MWVFFFFKFQLFWDVTATHTSHFIESWSSWDQKHWPQGARNVHIGEWLEESDKNHRSELRQIGELMTACTYKSPQSETKQISKGSRVVFNRG